jgi:hypothetical protein
VLPAGELSDTSDGAVEALTIAVKLEINNLILTHVAVSSWLSTFNFQGA